MTGSTGPGETADYSYDHLLPYDAVYGAELPGEVAWVLLSYGSAFGRDSAAVDSAIATAHARIEAGVPGEPLLVETPSGVTKQVWHVGIMRTPFYLTGAGMYHRTLTTQIEHLERNGDVKITDVGTMITHITEGSEHRQFIVGETAVRQRVTEMITGQDEITGEHVQVLSKLMFGRIPPDYFFVDDEQHAELCQQLMNYVIRGDMLNYLQTDALQLLHYIAGLDAGQQRALLESIEDQWAAMLPLQVDDFGLDVHAASEGLAGHHDQSDLRIVSGVMPPYRAYHANYLADLYTLRASQEHRLGSEDETPVALPVQPELADSYRKIALLGDIEPKAGQITDDVAYLRALRDRGYPQWFAVQMDHPLTRQAVVRLSQYIWASNDAPRRLAAFEALDYLLDVRDDGQRQEFYDKLIQHFGQTVPLENGALAGRHAGVAEAIGILMPNSVAAPDGTLLTGRARTAAVVSRMYRARAAELYGIELKKALAHEEPEETAATAAVEPEKQR